jgi:peroxiredoxin
MKKYLAVLLALFISLSACQRNADATDSTGKPIHLADFQGKWLVVNYWATWCKPCLVELPELNQLAANHADQVAVLGVSFDGLPNADIQTFAKSVNVQFPMLAQFPMTRFGVTDIPSLPVTFIINPQGKLVNTLYGPQTQGSILEVIKDL